MKVRNIIAVSLIAMAMFSMVGFSEQIFYEDFSDGSVSVPYFHYDYSFLPNGTNFIDMSLGTNSINGMTLLNFYGQEDGAGMMVFNNGTDSLSETFMLQANVQYTPDNKGAYDDCDVGQSYALGVFQDNLTGWIFSVTDYAGDNMNSNNCTGGKVDIYQVTNGEPNYWNTFSFASGGVGRESQTLADLYVYSNGDVVIDESGTVLLNTSIPEITSMSYYMGAIGRYDDINGNDYNETDTDYSGFQTLSVNGYVPPAPPVTTYMTISDLDVVDSGSTYQVWADYNDGTNEITDSDSAGCGVIYNNTWTDMTYNSANQRWEADMVFVEPVSSYQIQCSSWGQTNYEEQDATDTFAFSSNSGSGGNSGSSGQYSKSMNDLGAGIGGFTTGVTVPLVYFITALGVGMSVVVMIKSGLVV